MNGHTPASRRHSRGQSGFRDGEERPATPGQIPRPVDSGSLGQSAPPQLENRLNNLPHILPPLQENNQLYQTTPRNGKHGSQVNLVGVGARRTKFMVLYKSLVRKWWFWVLCGVILLLLGFLIGVLIGVFVIQNENTKEKTQNDVSQETEPLTTLMSTTASPYPDISCPSSERTMLGSSKSTVQMSGNNLQLPVGGASDCRDLCDKVETCFRAVYNENACYVHISEHIQCNEDRVMHLNCSDIGCKDWHKQCWCPPSSNKQIATGDLYLETIAQAVICKGMDLFSNISANNAQEYIEQICL